MGSGLPGEEEALQGGNGGGLRGRETKVQMWLHLGEPHFLCM